MKRNYAVLAAAIASIAFAHGASAQSYVPGPPIIKPNVLPKPVANRLIRRPTTEQPRGAEKADK